MDVHTRTTAVSHLTGLLSSLMLSSLVALTAATPIPPQEHPSTHYNRLERDTRALFTEHQSVYTSFKTNRHGDANIMLTDFRVVGVPSVHDLPEPSRRLAMEESHLLPLYYTRLQTFEQAFAAALQDEFRLEMADESSFYERMMEVHKHLERVISRLRQTMVRLELDHDYEANQTVEFATVTNRSILNMRILYVMQELNENLLPVMQDFSRFRQIHDQSS